MLFDNQLFDIIKKFRTVVGKYSMYLFEPLVLMFSQVDLMKDNILVWGITFYLGGIYVVVNNPTLFSPNVSDIS